MNQVNFDAENIEQVKVEATAEVDGVLRKLENDYPGVTEGMAAAIGATSGGVLSLAALSALGTSGLSAAGITSGLATAGIGGGMVAGIGVLAAPVAGLAVIGYWIASRRKKARFAVALGQAITKLYAIQQRLVANAEFFQAEIAGIKVAVEMLTRKKPR